MEKYMTKNLENIVQSISDYLSCPIACAKNTKDNEFYFYAYLKGRPANLVEFASNGKVSSFEQDGYNACIEKDEDGKEFYHRVDICDNVFVLPFKLDKLIDKIFEPIAKE
jgi:hypothetical protein